MVDLYTGGIDPIDANINNDQYCEIMKIHQATMLKTASMPSGFIINNYPPTPADTGKSLSMKNKGLLSCRYKIVTVKKGVACWDHCVFQPDAVGWTCEDTFDGMDITKQDLHEHVGKCSRDEAYKKRNLVDRFLRTCWYYITHIN